MFKDFYKYFQGIIISYNL